MSTNDKEAFYDLMLDSAWKGLEIVQQRVDRIDDKAYNVVSVSGALMVIFSGIIVGLPNIHYFFQSLLFFVLVFLSLSMYYGFQAVMLQKQGIIHIIDSFEKLYPNEYTKSVRNLALGVGNRQIEIFHIIEIKGNLLLKSMKCLRCALILIVIIAILSIFTINLSFGFHILNFHNNSSIF